jgi:outer membrane protein assembly factor BamE (lipoprotein component of BamABCDE complex)
MRIKNLFIIPLLLALSCKNAKQDERSESAETFQKMKWAVKVDHDYPYRDKMLADVLANHARKGVKREAILNLLGTPTKIDSGYLFYRVKEQRFGLLTLHTKTLVLKFGKDSTLEWAKIHE